MSRSMTSLLSRCSTLYIMICMKRSLTVLASLVVVLTITSSALFSSQDVSAYGSDGEAGYAFESGDDFTDEDLGRVLGALDDPKTILAIDISSMLNPMDWFSRTILECDFQGLSCIEAQGTSFYGSTFNSIYCLSYSIDRLSITVSVDSDSDQKPMFSPNSYGYHGDAIADAVTAYFGTDVFSEGDMFVFEGSMSLESSSEYTADYVAVDDQYCAIERNVHGNFEKQDFDVSITFIPSDGSDSKTIGLFSNIAYEYFSYVDYAFDTAAEDLSQGDDCTVTRSYQIHFFNDRIGLSVDGEEYLLDGYIDNNETSTSETSVRLWAQSDISYFMPYMHSDAYSHGDVVKTYDAASAAYAKISADITYERNVPDTSTICASVCAAIVMISLSAALVLAAARRKV